MLRGFVEQQDRMVCQDRPRQPEPLPLPTGERGTVLPDRSMQVHRQSHRRQCVEQLLVGGVRLGHAQIRRDVGVEHVRDLRGPEDQRSDVVAGEVIDFDPPHRYSHTFQFTNFDDPPYKVIYELKDIGGQVEFSLIIEDLVPGTKSAKQMVSGAKMITNTLKSIVETGKPSLGVRMLYVLFKLMAPLSPKRTRSENWQE